MAVDRHTVDSRRQTNLAEHATVRNRLELLSSGPIYRPLLLLLRQTRILADCVPPAGILPCIAHSRA